MQDDAYVESLKVLHDRIFIANDIEESSLGDTWARSVNAFNSSGDRHKFDDTFEIIKKIIIEMALKS